MLGKIYKYSLWYKLNFIPGLSIILFLLLMVRFLPSTSKITGYLFLTGLFISFIVLNLKEKVKVARKILVDDESIRAERYFSNAVTIKWCDIESLSYTVKGLFIVSGKLVRYLYAEVISIDGKKIVVRRDINGYDELIQLIEIKTHKVFML